jgi:hypothetical protein
MNIKKWHLVVLECIAFYMSIPPGCRKARELMENSPGDDGEQ